MLDLVVTLSESYDEENNRFIKDNFVLEMEHSLVSLSKWESEFEKPFLDETEKTDEEALAYIKAMVVTKDYPADIFNKLSAENLKTINEYIGRKMTGSWVNESVGKKQPPSREKITSELIYYWLVSYQIPWEAETWHLNRLFMLIKIFNAKNEKQKPKSKSEIAAERKALNDKRRAEMRSNG